jgi:hypothetical protein
VSHILDSYNNPFISLTNKTSKKKIPKQNLPSRSDVVKRTMEESGVDGGVNKPNRVLPDSDASIVDESKERPDDWRRCGSAVDETERTIDGYDVVGTICRNVLKQKERRSVQFSQVSSRKCMSRKGACVEETE